MANRPPTWWTREHPILRAGLAAEEAGRDIADAMRVASDIVGVTPDQYKVIVRRFHDENLVDSAILTGGAGTIDVHPRRLLPAGIDAANEEPPDVGGVFITVAERTAIEPVLAAVRDAVDNAHDLAPDRLADIEAHLESIHGQLKSPTPRRRIVGELLSTLRNVTENLVAAGIWVGIQGLLG
jgi:hypothetical protein